MQKIAVGIDFSRESDIAARQAAEIARHTGAELVLVHALGQVDLPLLPPDTYRAARESSDVYRRLLDEARENAAGELGRLAGRLGAGDLRVTTHLLEDFADTGLCSAARDLGVDLTVVGTHGRTGLRWFLLGSVAQRVTRLIDGDVLVARGERAGRGGFRRILVATDFSASSEQALDSALELAAPDALVRVVTFHWVPPLVNTVEQGTLGFTRDLESEVEDELRAHGEQVLAARRRERLDLQFEVVRQRPTPGVIHMLEATPFELVALGSHGRRGLQRAILGSVAEAVVRRAPCSVLIGRPREE